MTFGYLPASFANTTLAQDGARHVVPMHWGTFPALRGTPAELRQHLAGTNVHVVELRPGQTDVVGRPAVAASRPSGV